MGFFIFLIIVGIALSAIQKQRQSSTWQSVARHTGLAANSGSFFSAPTMSGTVRGVQVRAEVITRGAGECQHCVTRYTVMYLRSGPSITFRRQSVLSFFREFVGGRDAVTGDPRFDDSVVVDGPDSHALREYLTPARRAAILAIFSA